MTVENNKIDRKHQRSLKQGGGEKPGIKVRAVAASPRRLVEIWECSTIFQCRRNSHRCTAAPGIDALGELVLRGRTQPNGASRWGRVDQTLAGTVEGEFAFGSGWPNHMFT